MNDFRSRLKLLFESHQLIETNITYDGDVQMSQEHGDIINQFVDYIKAKLNLKKVPKLYFTSKRMDGMTTGAYDPKTDVFSVLWGKRALVDVLRTIAHELVHHWQKETGKFQPGEQVQNIGGQIEDEANAKAGEYIKSFVQDNNFDRIYDI
jgi:hypothetical protein